MKKLSTSLYVIVAAMVAFSGCTKEEIKTPVSEAKTVQFVAESIETKTAFGTPDGTTYPTLWTTNDEKVEVSMNLSSSKSYAITPSDDFKTARFEAEIADDESGSYTFYSVSPASANISFSDSYKSYNLEIPTTQTPSATSVDEKAQILVAKSETYNEFPNSVNLAYTHFTAYGKMSLTNLNLDGAVVSSVAITANKNIAYRYYYYPEKGTSAENGATSTITIMTSSVSDIWFACAPVDMSNSTMNVVVNTDKGTFTRKVTFPADRVFEAGKISIFSVNMAGISLESPEVYELVTDPTELTEGSKVIIVGDTYAMSTNQKSSNRAGETVSLSDDKTTITTPGAGVQIFTIEEGTKAETVAFNTGSGYIYAASSSSNHLKTQNGLDDNASWTVTISEGVTSVVAQGTNTRNTMRYNPNDGSPMFSCYGSTSTTGSTVSIYKLQGSGTVLENYLKVSEENIEVEADATSSLFTVKSDLEWTATSDNAVVTFEGNTVKVTFSANEEAEEQVYTVTVSADDVDPVIVTITQKGYVNPESLPKGIAAIKNAATSTTESDFDVTLTDAVVTYVSGSNAYIEDAEAGILVYKSGHGLQVGDKLNGEVSGKVKLYSNLREITAIDYTKASKTEGADVPVTVLTLAQLNADGAYDKYENMRIKIVDATVSADKQISQDGQTYALFFKNDAVTGFDVDNIIDVIGYPSKYNSAIQLNVWENAVFKSAAKTTITGVSDVTVEVGATKVINAAASSGAKVSYVSANTGVATVDENGTVTGVAEGETIITVSVPAYNGYPAAEETCMVTVKAAGGNEPVETITVSKSIKDISGTTTNGTKVSTLIIDDFITASASTAGNNGKVYNTGAEWRLYQSDKGTVTISAKDGSVINSVKLTYSVSNTGTLMNGNTQIESAVSYDVKAASVTYSVGNTGAATNGQVRVTAIEVVYQKN